MRRLLFFLLIVLTVLAAMPVSAQEFMTNTPDETPAPTAEATVEALRFSDEYGGVVNALADEVVTRVLAWADTQSWTGLAGQIFSYLVMALAGFGLYRSTPPDRRANLESARTALTDKGVRLGADIVDRGKALTDASVATWDDSLLDAYLDFSNKLLEEKRRRADARAAVPPSSNLTL